MQKRGPSLEKQASWTLLPGALSTLCLLEGGSFAGLARHGCHRSVHHPPPPPSRMHFPFPVPSQLVLVRYLQSGDRRHSQDRRELSPTFLHDLVVKVSLHPSPWHPLLWCFCLCKNRHVDRKACSLLSPASFTQRKALAICICGSCLCTAEYP